MDRRDFLKIVAAGIVGAVLPIPTPPYIITPDANGGDKRWIHFPHPEHPCDLLIRMGLPDNAQMTRMREYYDEVVEVEEGVKIVSLGTWIY